jgi:hypothetical protein
MYEDIGTLISRGFETWRRNLNLAVPFVLMIVAIILLAVVMVVAILYPLISASPDVLATAGNFEDPEQLVDLLSSMTNAGLLAAVVILGILAMILSGTYFTAGAIGMAQEATDTGKTTLKAMWASGRRHFLSLFLAEVLMMIIVVLILAVFSLPFTSSLVAGFESGNLDPGQLILWVALFIALSLILSIVLAMVPYALVVDGLGPIDAIKVGVRFFLSNKMDVFIVWLVVMAVSVAIQFLSVPFSGSETASAIVSAIVGVASVLVISPLTTVWWTRLYMTRAGKISEVEAVVPDEEVKYL